MITALNKQTNEVLGFPDGMSQDAINSAIQSDKIGRPVADVNPNTYDTVIRPALQESAQSNDPSILYAARAKQVQVDPFLSTLFNPFGLLKSSDQNIQTEQALNVQAHPDQAMIGNLVQQVGTIAATAGVAGGVIAPIAERLGFLARGMTPMAIRGAQIGSGELLPQVAGEAIRKTVTSAASAGMVGALYNGISTGVEQGKGMIDNNQAPDLLKIGQSIAKGLGWSVYGSGGMFADGALGISAASATVGGTAYLMSKADGADESDARLNGVVMTAFTALTHGNFNFQSRQKLVSDLQDTIAGYTLQKNPETEQNNIHQLVGDEMVGKTAKDLLRDKYKAQLEQFNNSDYVRGIKNQANDLRNPPEEGTLENETYAKLNQLDTEWSGQDAIDEVVKTQPETEELVKRLADQVVLQGTKPTNPFKDKEAGISKIGTSVEIKAKDQGITEGFDKTATYRPTTFEEQKTLTKDVGENVDDMRATLRGEKPLPENVEAGAYIAKVEEYLKTNPDGEITYELANSPLITETSGHGRGLSIARMREQDSFSKSIAELKQKKLQMAKEVAKDVPKKAKEEMNKVNLYKEDLDLDKFLDEIKC